MERRAGDLGGIEASLRRTAHYDYWSDTVRRSVLVDSKADMLIFGNGERPLVEVAHRPAQGEPVSEIRDVRNTAIMVKEALPGWSGVDSRIIDMPGKIDPIPHPYGDDLPCADNKPVEPKKAEAKAVVRCSRRVRSRGKNPCAAAVLRKVKSDKVLYAHASRILHHETNPGCARSDAKSTASAMSGLTRRRSRSLPKRWTASLLCRTSVCRIRHMATAVFRRTR